MFNFKAAPIKANKDGEMDLVDLKEVLMKLTRK
jgi:hypothetical protein